MSMTVKVKKISGTDKTRNGNLILNLICEDCGGNEFSINLILRNDEEKHFIAKQFNLLKAGKIDEVFLRAIYTLAMLVYVDETKIKANKKQ